MKSRDGDKKKIFLGFDGFVDRILKPVYLNADAQKKYYTAMSEWLEYMRKMSGKSFSVEMEMIEERQGGNMPNMAIALCNLGFDVTGIGAMGYPEIHPVFQKLQEKCTIYSVCNPGYCDAVEFGNEKIMFSINTQINNFNDELLLNRFPENKLISLLEACDGFAFLNWGELSSSPAIWRLLISEILPKSSIAEAGRKPLLIDFSDFSSKTIEQIYEMSEQLNVLNEYFEVTISLNKNEVDLFHEKIFQNRFDSHEKLILEIAAFLPCQNMVIHMLNTTEYINNGVVTSVNKNVCKHPKVVTGGGDHFNAGLLAGLVQDWELERAIRFGNNVVNRFVETGSSESLQTLKNIFEKNTVSY